MISESENALTNWAGNVKYSTKKISYPETFAAVLQAVKHTQKFKVLGTRHCFNKIADSRDQFLSLQRLNKILSLDIDKKEVVVEGGVNYGQLSPYLHNNGFALHNLASLPHISIAGAVATATHGSGKNNGNLATAVTGIEFITANGDIVTLSKEEDEEKLHSMVVGLGALGVVTKLSLQIQPTYLVQQYVFEELPIQQLNENFDKIMSSGYSVSLFTDWQKSIINEVWIKKRNSDNKNSYMPSEFHGAKAATKNLHPIAELSAEHCTDQQGVPGPWHERLPHFKMGFTPSSGKELQSEYFVPEHHAIEALLAITRLSQTIAPHLFISEIRSIQEDELWMSPCYKQSSVAFHFTWKQNWKEVSKILPDIERELAPFDVKPHWGKLFSIPGKTLRKAYPMFTDFTNRITQYDPKGKFRNQYIGSIFE